MFLTGCATMKQYQQNVRKNYLKSLQAQGKVDDQPLKENEGIVFGSLVIQSFNKDGQLLSPEEAPKTSSPELFVTESKNIDWNKFSTYFLKAIYKKAEIYGAVELPYMIFAKRLPAGEYTIYYLKALDRYLYLDIRFTVIPGKVTYIGSLGLNLYNNRRLGTDYLDKVQTKIVNQENKDKKAFLSQNPTLDYEITTQLMKRYKRR
jgi:hypothetical protein